MRKHAKTPISKIQRLIWEECKRIIKFMYGRSCYTCGKTNLGKYDRHTGHMFPKGAVGAYLKYDLRNLRPQCYHCNINCGGMGAVFIEKMRRIEGDAYVDKMIQDKQKIVKAYDFYVDLLIQYQKIKTKSAVLALTSSLSQS